jgi:hypothetical protein
MKKIIAALMFLSQVTYADVFDTAPIQQEIIESISNVDFLATPGCSQIGNGYDKYIVAYYFLGPNVNPPPNPNPYPNIYNSSSVTVWGEVILAKPDSTATTTISPANFDSVVKIHNNMDPSESACGNTVATFAPTLSGKRYRAVIFYKSWTLPAGAQVRLRWSY